MRRRHLLPPLLLLCAAGAAALAGLVPGSGPAGTALTGATAGATTTTAGAASASASSEPQPRAAPRKRKRDRDPGPRPRDVLGRDTGAPPPPPPPYVPVATPAPDQDDALAKQGFRQETFYACSTRAGGGAEHCGWHVPVVRAGAAPTPQAASTAAVGVGVACLAAVFALAMT